MPGVLRVARRQENIKREWAPIIAEPCTTAQQKACQFRKEMSMGCGCGSVTPYGCHHEATSQRYLVK
ncbi:hypothetical protein PAL_GLEAN10001349 [Pteropus alecto]|uniref:Uncharacterized protein n=1 Tax=Pteropus alecto TaxID=9402 RepID=L5KIM4_PTEAL|nr:hypothetical protein PAL_GLEAN10001349 [Pteropus alecto]